MNWFFKKLSLVPSGLRYKLMVAYVLMSIIPLAICVYLATNYIFPFNKNIWDISLQIFLTILLAVLGLKISKDIIFSIIDIALQAKAIAKGNYDRFIEVKDEDEIGELGNSLNVLTRRIRENMEELRSYGERNKEISIEISKKVLILSGLLQIGNHISQGSPLEKTLRLIIEKMSQSGENNTSFFMLVEDNEFLAMNASCNLRKEELKTLRVKKADGFLGKTILNSEVIVLDRRSRLTPEANDFLNNFQLKNCVLLPITIHDCPVGILGWGNCFPDYEFKEDETELLKLFSRQVAIAIDNEFLVNKNKELVVKDELTGLYNKKFIISRLKEEINRAIFGQRPCSFAVLNIDDMELYRRIKGDLAAEEIVKKIGKIIQDNVTEVERVGRLSGSEFAVIMPEKNKKQANTLAESLRRSVETHGIKGCDGYPRNFVTVSAGVSENPLDGATAEELINKAASALNEANSRGKNVVVSS